MKGNVSEVSLTTATILRLAIRRCRAVVSNVFHLGTILRGANRLRHLAGLSGFIFGSSLRFFLLLSPKCFLHRVSLF